MSGYIGNIPTPQATQSRDSFTATASQTSFATAGYTAGFLDVYLNGVHLLDSADYTATNGSDIVLTVGAAAGDVLEVVSYSTFEVLDPTFTGTTTTEALTVTGAFTSKGIDDNAASTAVTIDASGSVGIGAAAPAWKLELDNNADSTLIQVIRGAGNAYIGFGVNGDNAIITGGTASASEPRNLTFRTANSSGVESEAMRIDSSGHAIIPAGITLGTAAGVYSAANTLDDYEEGTWTPVFSSLFTQGCFDTATGFSRAIGTYVKVGGMVWCYAEIEVAGGTGSWAPTANYSITNSSLPFTPAANGGTGEFYTLQGTQHIYNAVGNGIIGSGMVTPLNSQTVLVVTTIATSGTIATSNFAQSLSIHYRTA
jgi:hypothetical protein